LKVDESFEQIFMRKQRGGTFLGLIIGALLGLGAALAVAVYVTKVPVPFMNKSPSRGGVDGDAAEAKKNKDWNPNGPLATKTPVKPQPPPPIPAAPELAAVPAPPAAVVAGAKPAASAPPGKAAKPPPSLDPLGDLAKAKLESPTVLPGVDPFTYFIQAGAFRTPEDAEQQRARLMLLGVQARVSEREQSGRTVYRVRLGPFERKEDADAAKTRLDNNSIETALVRVQR
jgi:cell division protein FtsN